MRVARHRPIASGTVPTEVEQGQGLGEREWLAADSQKPVQQPILGLIGSIAAIRQ